MANNYFYSSIAVQATLSGSISAGATSATVNDTTGWPVSYPFIVAIDYGVAGEELVKVTNNSANTLTIVRGFNSTSAVSHSLGANVRHVYCAQDATDFRTHEVATGAIHGVSSTIVGTTDTQTLSNKTYNAGIFSGTWTGTMAGTPTFSGAIPFTGSPVFSSNPSFTGNPTFSGNPGINLPLASAGNVGIQLTAAASATGNLLVLNNNTPSPLFTVGAKGAVTVSPVDTATVPFLINAPTAVSVDLERWQINGVTQSRINSLGEGVFIRGLIGGNGVDGTQLAVFRGTDSSPVNDIVHVNNAANNATLFAITAGGGFTANAASTITAGGLTITGNVSVTGNLTATGVGGTVYAYKTNDLSRASTTTLATDPDLTLGLGVGTWIIEGMIFYNGANGSSDIKQQFIYGSTSTNNFFNFLAPNVGGLVTSANVDATQLSGPVSNATLGAGNIISQRVSGSLIATGAGTLSYQWSQNTSNATATVVRNSSWIRAYRQA